MVHAAAPDAAHLARCLAALLREHAYWTSAPKQVGSLPGGRWSCACCLLQARRCMLCWLEATAAANTADTGRMCIRSSGGGFGPG